MQTTSPAPHPTLRSPGPLEFHVRRREAGGHFFGGRWTSPADFLSFVADEARGEAIVFRMPWDLLNPNYWEAHTKDGETDVRNRVGGLIARTEGPKTLLWRADAVSRDRLFRDGVDVQAEILFGHAFRVRSESLGILAGECRSDRDRLEFVSFDSLPSPVSRDLALAAHRDVVQSRLDSPGARFVFAGEGSGTLRAVFSSAAPLRRLVATVLRNWVRMLTRVTPAFPSDAVCDSLLRIADGVRLRSDPHRDFVDKHRTCEFTAHLELPEGGEEKGSILVYYDTVSGVWAVCG